MSHDVTAATPDATLPAEGETTANNTLPLRPPPQPTAFQLKQQNEGVINRLLAAGIFPNKQIVIRAALTTLLESLTTAARMRNMHAAAEAGEIVAKSPAEAEAVNAAAAESAVK